MLDTVWKRSALRLLTPIVMLAGGCGSSDGTGGADGDPGDGSPPVGSWNLTGTIRGIDLQQDVRSAFARRIDDGTSIRTAVSLANLDDYCTLSQANPHCPGQGAQHRLIEVMVPGTATGTFPITSGDQTSPPAGESGLFFLALGDSCQLLTSTLDADSGSVTFTEIDLTPGGQVSFTFNVSTSEGPVSGTVTAPYCD